MDLCSTWECKGISQVTHMKEATFSMEGIWKGYLVGEKKYIKWKRFGQRGKHPFTKPRIFFGLTWADRSQIF